LACFLQACKQEDKESDHVKSLPKGTPLELNYENVTILIEDMQRFSKALRPLNAEKAKAIDERYKGVFFEQKAKPLFLNIYPDIDNKRVVFLIAAKDPATGSNAMLKFDKNLPVANSKDIELQIRLPDPEEPLTCWLSMEDPGKYVSEVQGHLFTVRYKLFKKFLQSGTFDFDALTLPTYRPRGVPFIVFDIDDAELTDTSAKLSCKCQQI
jgi:hypothetical protein